MRMKQAGGMLAVAALASCLMSTAARAEQVTLTYSKWLPADYYLERDVFVPWLQQIEKVTEGRVKVEIPPKGVGSVAGQYDVVADGLADISFIVTAYTPGRFPLTDGLELPFMSDDPVKRCNAFSDAYDKYLEPMDIFKEVKVLSFFCTSVAHFAMTKEPITSIDQFHGKKIRTSGTMVSEIIKLLDAVPITKPTPEIYELASGGVIDGAVFPIDPIPSFRLESVLKKITFIPGGLSGTVNLIPVNKAKWDKISPEDQKAIMEISGKALANAAGVAAQNEAEKALAVINAAGGEVIMANDQLIADMKVRVAPLKEAWIQKAKELGMADPEGMLKLVEDSSN